MRLLPHYVVVINIILLSRISLNFPILVSCPRIIIHSKKPQDENNTNDNADAAAATADDDDDEANERGAILLHIDSHADIQYGSSTGV